MKTKPRKVFFMSYEEKTVQKNYVYKGKILTLRCDDATLPNGQPCKREIIEHSGGACVLYVEDEKVLLVRQYRYAYGESIYEIPAGKLEVGEEPMLAAARSWQLSSSSPPPVPVSPLRRLCTSWAATC